MSLTRVGVIGAGVSGPAAAMFLKQKGYDPVLYERLDAPVDAGLGLGIQYNGQRVLSRIPGLLEHINGFQADEFHFYSVLPEDPGLLGISEHPRRQRETYGFGSVSVERPVLHRRLVEYAQKLGVSVKFGHKLETLEQAEGSVTVTFADGVQETFSFVIGCDGLHSNTRSCLLGRRLQTTRVWHRVNMREPEAKEEWKSIDPAVAEDFKKNSPFSEWPFGAGELVRNSLKIVRYGIYDRPELKTWFQGRVVLVGDAAHPTNPHLGQGANQSYEDLGLLIDLLEKHNPSAASPSTDTLKTIFAEFERARLSLTAHLVKKARIQGEMRVVTGAEECIKRNDFYRDMCADPAKLKARFGV